MYNLIGIQNVNYTSKSGTQVTGTRLFATFKDDNIKGLGCEAIWVPNNVDIPKLDANAAFDVSYNRYGRVSAIIAL